MREKRKKESEIDALTYAKVKASLEKKLSGIKYEDNDKYEAARRIIYASYGFTYELVVNENSEKAKEKQIEDTVVHSEWHSNSNEDDVTQITSHHKRAVVSFGNSTKGELVDLCKRYKFNYIDVPATDRRMDVLNYTNNDNAMMIGSDDMIRVTFEEASFRGKPSSLNPLVPTLDELKIGIIRYCKEHDPSSSESKVMNKMKDHARITAYIRLREKRRRLALPAKLIDTRRLMELFCTLLLRRYNIIASFPNSLFNMIKLLQNSGIVRHELAASMHKVRYLGNIAVHNIDNLPQADVIDSALSHYMYLRQFYFNDLERL